MALPARKDPGVPGNPNKIHPFEVWLREKLPVGTSRRTQRAAALAVGVSTGYLSSVLDGRMKPSVELMRRMSRLTKGTVRLAEIQAFHRRYPPTWKPKRGKVRAAPAATVMLPEEPEKRH